MFLSEFTPTAKVSVAKRSFMTNPLAIIISIISLKTGRTQSDILLLLSPYSSQFVCIPEDFRTLYSLGSLRRHA